jgi:hypothetical protein
VDYGVLDAAKRAAVAEAATTSGLLALAGGAALEESRGEPAFVVRVGDMTLVLVIV